MRMKNGFRHLDILDFAFVTRNVFIKTLLVAFLMSLLLLSGTVQADPTRPNIILIMTDDMGYGDVGFNGMRINGQSTTPNLDQLAAAGIKFTRFYAGGPVCSPTRATCMTGRHYWRHGIWEANVGELSEHEITIPKVLNDEYGYATALFGKWHIGSPNPAYSGSGANGSPPYPEAFGLDEHFLTHHSVKLYDPFGPSGTVIPENNPYWHNGIEAVHGATVNVPGSTETYNLTGDDSRIMMDQVVPFIERSADANEPFFAMVWFHTPHKDVAADPKWQTLYEPYVGGKWDYHGAISGMDEQIGRMIDTLTAKGYLNNTMIWFTSDNGPLDDNSTDGLRGKKRSLFNGGVNMPAFMYWPGHAQAGTVEDEFCSTLDYLPTIFDLLDYTMPDARPIDGTSILPLVTGQPFQRSGPIPFTFQHKYGNMSGSPVCSWLLDGYKFLTNSPDSPTGGPEELLYYIPNDRYEEDNMFYDPAHAARISSMRSAIGAFLISAESSWQGDDYGVPGWTPANSNFRDPRTGWNDGDPANFPPTFINNPFSMADGSEGTSYFGSLTTVSFDPDGDVLSFNKLGGPSWLSVALNGNLSGTPSTGDLGLNEFSVECNDGNGGVDESTLHLFVVSDGTNTQPSVVIDGDKPRVVNIPSGAGQIDVSLDATISDDGLPDPPASVTVSWTVESQPAGSSVIFDPNQYVEDITVTLDTPGTYNLKLSADDSQLIGEDSIVINVTDGVLTELTLSPLDDTFVNSADPATNFGTTGKLELSSTKHAYLKFDLSAAQNIQSATLALACVKNGSITEVYSAEYGGSGEWFEETLIWNNDDLVQGGMLDSQTVTVGGFYDFDVSNLVVGPDGKATLLLRVASGKAHFGAKENGTASQRPVLTVTCLPNTPGDLNGDGKVDLGDVATLSADWQIGYDINDLIEIAQHWLEP